MKRTLLILAGIFVSLASFALSKDSANAVTMLDYEQSWSDNTGSLSLKNNTDTPIENVVFQITYLNMTGQPIDYKDYYKAVSIAPGKTRRIEIPAFQHERSYSYYKSEADYVTPHRFKIRFELTGYNIKSPKDNGKGAEKSLETDDFIDRMGPILGLSMAIFALGIVFGLYVIVAVMANKRHRNAVLWIILSFITTPLLVIFILLIIGKAYDRNNEEDYIR
jgi:hypothetical protein